MQFGGRSMHDSVTVFRPLCRHSFVNKETVAGDFFGHFFCFGRKVGYIDMRLAQAGRYRIHQADGQADQREKAFFSGPVFSMNAVGFYIVVAVIGRDVVFKGFQYVFAAH